MKHKDLRDKSNRTSESRSKSVKKRRFNTNERTLGGDRDHTHSPDIHDASKQNTLMLLKMERRVLKKNLLEKKFVQPKQVGDHSQIERYQRTFLKKKNSLRASIHMKMSHKTGGKSRQPANIGQSLDQYQLENMKNNVN